MNFEAFVDYRPYKPEQSFDGDKRIPLNLKLLKVAEQRGYAASSLLMPYGEDCEHIVQRSLINYANHAGSQGSNFRMLLMLLPDEIANQIRGSI